MYSVYKEIHPPTGVEHCIRCYFFDNDKENLVVASTSLLRVFEINEVINGDKGKPRLVQKGEYRLHGNIQSMDKVRLTHSSHDILLLAFKDAKLSLVEYDAEVNGLKTLSMHQFEDDDMRGGLHHNYHRPVVRMDPEGRCAAMAVFGSHLAILPFQQTSLLDDTFVNKGETHDILPSYTIDLKSLPEAVATVKDITFLEGYNSPTILVLCEPMPTWAGRISLRQDSMTVIGLSLNTADKIHTIVWTVHHLPYDMSSFLPVPKPLGGVLVFGCNSVIYLNQSSPPYGVSLNTISEISSRFPLKPSNISITVDCCHPLFITSEQVIISLRNGDIYILTLVSDNGMRGIKSLTFDKLASSILTSCISGVGSNFLFLGSRLGNSLLLRYYVKQDGGISIKNEEPMLLGDLDDLYGNVPHTEHTQSSSAYKFEVCDSLVCIGPVSDACVGEPAFLSEEFSHKSDHDLELVLCSGHGKNGSLSVLQHSVRPQVVTTFELPGCTNMWTVLSEQDDKHSFLILSREETTMVLQTGQEITELDSSGFSTQSTTVFAGNMKKFIIQATLTDVRLLDGLKQLHYVPLDMRGGVKSCDICGPHVIVLLNEGIIGLLELQEDEEPSLSLSWPKINKGSKITHISAYTDNSSLFTTEGSLDREIVHQQSPPTKKPHLLSIDEEDQLLYGDIFEVKSLLPQQTTSVPQTKIESSHWCILSRENGSMEIYRLPDFNLVFSVRNFGVAPHTLCDSGPIPLTSPVDGGTHSGSDISIDDIICVGMGPGGIYPYIMAIVNKELVVYEAYVYKNTTVDHLKLRFSKISHHVLLHDRKDTKLSKHFQQGVSQYTSKLRIFQGIAGYSGVFVCGTYPHWIFMSYRHALNIHPMYIDGPVLCFAPFNNVNCQNGFLYFNSESELRICVLPVHLSYDSYWPVRKVPLNSTPHFIGYHMESKTHVVVTSESKPLSVIPQVGADDNEVFEHVERDERFVLPNEDVFHVQLYSPTSWEPVPTAKVTMDTFHHVTSMKVMSLRSQETLSGRKEFIVVATTTLYGEDLNSKGKIQIYDIIEVIPEPGKPLTKHKLKSLYSQDQKWPVTGLDCVDGLILTCMGQKIFMWQFKDKKDLMAVAFIDAETYIHSARSIRGLILISDISRSVQLLQYQEKRRSLSLISEDMSSMEVYGSDFLIDGSQIGFIVSDSDQNVVLFQYQPENPDSNGGAFLTRQADFNAGTNINVFLRIRCKTSASLGASHEIKIALADKRQCTFFGTLDGGLGYILPVPEKVYRRLSMLQIKLTQGIRHIAGLNPKAFRTYSSRYHMLYGIQRNMLDGELIWQYLNLSLKEKNDFAKQIGTFPAQILEDLKEIEKVTSHF